MAHTQEQILEGLAEIVNEIAGIPVEDVQWDKSFTDDLDVDGHCCVHRWQALAGWADTASLLSGASFTV